MGASAFVADLLRRDRREFVFGVRVALSPDKSSNRNTTDDHNHLKPRSKKRMIPMLSGAVSPYRIVWENGNEHENHIGAGQRRR